MLPDDGEGPYFDDSEPRGNVWPISADLYREALDNDLRALKENLDGIVDNFLVVRPPETVARVFSSNLNDIFKKLNTVYIPAVTPAMQGRRQNLERLKRLVQLAAIAASKIPKAEADISTLADIHQHLVNLQIEVNIFLTG
jgi:hypothetical protein